MKKLVFGKFCFLISSLVCLLGGQVFAAQGAVVEVNSQVEISAKANWNLADLVSVRQGQYLLLRAFEETEIEKAESIPASELTKKIRQALRNMPEGSLVAEPQVKVASVAQVKAVSGISQEHVERLMLNRLALECADCVFSIQFNRVPVLSSQKWEFDFSTLTAKGSFMIPVREEGALSPKWITGSLQKKRMAAVANRLLMPNDRIQPGDVGQAFVDVTFSKDGLVSPQDLIGQVVGRSISSGSPIWAGDVKREPATKRGQMVRAFIGEGADFEITTNMIAEDQGFVGDMIKVKNPETQKILSGLVVEKGVVKIQ